MTEEKKAKDKLEGFERGLETLERLKEQVPNIHIRGVVVAIDKSICDTSECVKKRYNKVCIGCTRYPSEKVGGEQ